MSAESEIAELDASLAQDGEDIILRRVVGQSTATQQFIDVDCRAFVRGFTASELNAGITQQDSRVILSPTQINRAQWPGGEVVSMAQFQVDRRVPSKNRNDQCIIAGRKHSVESAKGILLDGALIRIDMVVRAVA